MLLSAFGDALAELGWPGASNSARRQVLLTSLDHLGCGFVCRADLEWLDKWDPPEWIIAQPDHDAWLAFRAKMLAKYHHPLRAWRNLLDLDNSNTVSWTEFKNACDRLQWDGNRGGAWRHLDSDLNGSITMDEYDEPSAQLLGSFKKWAEKNFGSVELAFKTLDATGSGVLNYQHLKRACNKLKWQGDVRLLFEFLDCGAADDDVGKKTISLKEVAFLDNWEDDVSPEQQAEDTVVGEALAKRKVRSSEVMTWDSIPQAPCSEMFKMQSLDGLYKTHRRQAVIKSVSEPTLNKAQSRKQVLSGPDSLDGLSGISPLAQLIAAGRITEPWSAGITTDSFSGPPDTVHTVGGFSGLAPSQKSRHHKASAKKLMRVKGSPYLIPAGTKSCHWQLG
jgi:hypothetical protein